MAISAASKTKHTANIGHYAAPRKSESCDWRRDRAPTPVELDSDEIPSSNGMKDGALGLPSALIDRRTYTRRR